MRCSAVCSALAQTAKALAPLLGRHTPSHFPTLSTPCTGRRARCCRPGGAGEAGAAPASGQTAARPTGGGGTGRKQPADAHTPPWSTERGSVWWVGQVLIGRRQPGGAHTPFKMTDGGTVLRAEDRSSKNALVLQPPSLFFLPPVFSPTLLNLMPPRPRRSPMARFFPLGAPPSFTIPTYAVSTDALRYTHTQPTCCLQSW